MVFLKDATKRYDKVDVHVHPGGAGRNYFAKNYWRRLEEVAEIVNRHGPDDCLIIHPKPGGKLRDASVDLMSLVSLSIDR